MKATNRWLLFGVIVASLTYGHASLQAQPASEPAPTGGTSVPDDGKPIPDSSAPVSSGGGTAPWDQGVSIESRQAARALFLEGNQLMQTLLFAKAAEKYIAALEKWKHPRFYFNLALAQIGLGQEVEARESLEHAVEYGAAPIGEQEFEEARKKLHEVTLQLGQIRVTCQTPGAEVTLDGVTLFTGPGSYQGWVKPKAHEITAKKTGYLSEARRVVIVAGQLQNIELKLITLSQATDASRRWAAWKPWAVVAAGGAIAAIGGVFHARSFGNFEDYDHRFSRLMCAMGEMSVGCSEGEIGSSLNNQLTRARQQQAVAVGSYIAGGSLVAAGVLLLYLNRPRLEERPQNSAIKNMTVGPAASSSMIGIQVNMNH